MSRKFEEEPEKENSERWLLTYSDLITLLLALFIILYAMSSVDAEKFKKMSKYFKSAFNTSTQGDESAEIPDSIGDINISSSDSKTDSSTIDKANTQANTQANIEANAKIDAIYSDILKYIKDNNLSKMIDITKTQNELKITLKDSVLFVPDTANMLNNSQPILKKINTSLIEVYDKIDHITISGHTADYFNDGKKSSEFEWQLSTNRALTVLNYFKNNKLPEYKLSIEGYSHFNPNTANPSKDIAKNRRVEITIHKNNIK